MESSSPWRRPSDDDRARRLSDDWYPGEWLEPVEPDIVRPFLERYMEGMSRRMADYMRAQGIPEAADSDEGAVEGDASGSRRAYAVDFLNLCLIVDQEHTFPIGARNLADGFYEPDEETVMAAAMMLQFEFDRFVDFVSGLDPHIGRHAFVAALHEAYGYRGDIDSEGFLGVLVARTAGRMAAERLRDWSRRYVDGAGAGGDRAAGAGGGAWERRIRSHLDAWGVTAHDGADHGGFAAMPDHALDHAKDHWVRCVAGARRHTPRARRDVEAWCVWHAVLEIVWGADRRAYDVRWNGVDMPERDSRRFGGLPSPEHGGTMADALDGSAWNTLMGRMVVAHRRVSRGYSRWCDMMPDENDIAMIRLESRAIADTTEFTERTFAALCNALVRGDVEPPGDARGAMRMLLAYACVGRSVNLDGGGLRGGGNGAESDGMPGEYVYVGLRNAILGYDGYGGVRRTLAPDEYRDYVALVSGGSATAGDAAACGGASAHGDDGRIRDCRRRSVWMFPGMEDRFDSVRASLQAQVREAMAAGIDLGAMDLGTAAPDDASTIPEAWWRFHDVADKAVSRWLGGETIHAAAVDGHGHALAYRSTNPVAAYQDVNAWRLAEALERYEGERGWGSGGRLADLYRDRGHLSKGGGRAADRSIRDYADSARGTGDAVQYLAAVTGLGMMLGSDASVETFVRLIDLCDRRGGECFRKSCWTLIRVAKAKRLRLTVPGAHGRHVGVRLLELMLSDPERLAEAEREFKIANLRRAFSQRRGGGHGGDVAHPWQPRDADSWRAVARDIDAAEHVVRDVMLAVFARLRATDRRWAAILVMPADCVGSRIDPSSGGACVLHGASEHAGATTGKADPRKGTGT
ncbi:hypothetical protein [Bifidobacterium jacchi]|uniref:Uncharacterized protein n=1 Tax=Bifidobacterium jacchi TaxID=2490545 RepID=A0A5N5RK15_9BIFI|nr:hypothetical protein [Bifidobacterium jacchi]KAB5607652.1 hypothetical protein EHS19_04120 [Bifidobacterium jacchi]